jgi:hypothetical protein
MPGPLPQSSWNHSLPSTICGKEGRKEGKKEGRKEGREGGINTGAFDMCIWPYVLHTLILVGPGF